MNENNQLNTKDKEEIVSSIRMLVNRMVDEQIMQLSKQPNAIIDEEAIKVRCVNEVSNKMKNELESHFTEMLNFIEEINNEDPSLLEIPNSKESKITRISEVTNWSDIENIEPIHLADEKKEELYQKGVKFFEERQFNKAINMFEILLSYDANNSDVWFAKGMAEQNMDSIDAAMYSYSQAIKITPYFLTPYLQLMECLLLCDKKEEANQLYDLFMNETDPTDYPDQEIFQNKLDVIKKYLEKVA